MGFKFFHGKIKELTISEQWEQLMGNFQPGTLLNYPNVWTGTTYTPTWQVYPGLYQYTPQEHIQYTPPTYTTFPNHTITTTPNLGTGYITIPYNGATNFAESYSLTTSNPNGITYTTSGNISTTTTSIATYSSSAFTSKFT